MAALTFIQYDNARIYIKSNHKIVFMANKINVQGTLTPSVPDTPLDYRTRVDYTNDIETIPLAWIGMHVYSKEDGKEYIIKRLQPGVVGGREIPNYYPAPKSQGGYEEFLGGGGSPSPTPTPTPTDLTAGDIYFNDSDIYGSNTTGKKIQNLASDILSLAEGIHNLSGDIGNLNNLNTENKQDLVAAINEVLASTGSTIAVVDNLVSNSTTDALSAYQGKVLKGLVDGKVAGIKIQGESSVLPMDSNGIVTIPAGGGGTGTITGATVGGAQVPEVSGILQFQAYPTVPIKSIQVDGAQNPLNPDGNGKVIIPAQPNVPITGINDANGNALTPVGGIVTLPQAAAAPTADTMTYNNSTTYSNGSIGKALHDTIAALGYEYSTSSTIATNPSHNMYYDLTGSAISTLDVSSISLTNDKEIIILFLTDSSDGCSITLAETPTPQRIIGSTSLAKGQVYIMSILRGVVCLVEAPAFVAPVAVLSSEPE